MGDSRRIRMENTLSALDEVAEEVKPQKKKAITFVELDEEEVLAETRKAPVVLLEEEPAPVAEVVEPAREEPFSGSLLDMPLEDLDLSLRTRVSLEGHGVTTLRQLLQMTVSDCRKVRNMTQEGLDEIEYQLGLMRFSLKDEY